MGRFAGGEIVDQYRGSNVSQYLIQPGEQEVIIGQLAAVVYSVEKLGSLLHNGKVCCEVGVKYFLKSEPTCRAATILPVTGSADRHTEFTRR